MIHQYKNNGYNIVLDVNSGSVHVADPVMYDAVAVFAERMPDLEKPEPVPEECRQAVFERLGGTYERQEIQETLEDIQELIDQEQLFAKDIYRDLVIDFRERKTGVKALCLHIAHDCNLAFLY